MNLFKGKVKCSICDIDVVVTEINEHEDYCGSRTEKCLSCEKYVMLKYKTQHITSNHVFFKITDDLKEV
ncbi:conserved hypothetical protein [Pediculus humanus corporis]|uniref:TRAFD1/XAF1 zinc finger domain-containing protein n=1 Tax=Pediculus humanus subsp. corporis TaxID=121224 RepID=E0VR62_PEDHC|nr:uncharacterized protein Phum_PHUM392800 [Pediculus humanus corporis]EEB15868.1 conserved hypothetical protein [Pediculus humanus corporis]